MRPPRARPGASYAGFDLHKHALLPGPPESKRICDPDHTGAAFGRLSAVDTNWPASPVGDSYRRVARIPRISRIALPCLLCRLRHVLRNAHVLAPSRRVAPGRRVHRRLPRRLSAPHHRRAALRLSGPQYGAGRPGRQCPAGEFGDRRVRAGGPGRDLRPAATGPDRAGAGHGGVRLRRPGRVGAAGGHGRDDRRLRLRHGDRGGRRGHRRPARSAPHLVARAAQRLRDGGRPVSVDPAPRRRPPAAVRLDRRGRPARLARHGAARRWHADRSGRPGRRADCRTAAPGWCSRAACSSGRWRRTRCGASAAGSGWTGSDSPRSPSARCSPPRSVRGCSG